MSESNIPQEVFDEIAKIGYKGPKFCAIFSEKFKESKKLTIDELAFIDIHSGHSFMSAYSRVPKDLRDEIELLWQLFHNPAKNIEATRNLNTCIGTRGEKLRELTSRHGFELANIGMNTETKALQLQEAKSILDIQMGDFKTNLSSGRDSRLGLNTKILRRYGKKITIESYEDCAILQMFKPEDLKALLKSDSALIENLAFRIQEKALEYLIETPLHTLEVVVPIIIKVIDISLTDMNITDLPFLPEEKKHLS